MRFHNVLFYQSGLVLDVLSLIARSVNELKEVCHIHYQEEIEILLIVQQMIMLSSDGKISFNWDKYDRSERKILLLLYSQYLGAGSVLQRYSKNISDAPIFNGSLKEDSEAFLSIWKNNLTMSDDQRIEWHMPSIELWYDLFFLQKRISKLWPCLIEIVALQPYKTKKSFSGNLPLFENLAIDQRLENTHNFHLLMTLLIMSRKWNCYMGDGIEPHNDDDNNDNLKGYELKIFSNVEMVNVNSRYRRILMTLNVRELSGWILIGSCKPQNRNKLLTFPPSLRELEERQARTLFVQRIEGSADKAKPVPNNPSIMYIISDDCSLEPIDIDMMSIDLVLGLDIWFIGDNLAYQHLYLG